ncbi:MAG: exosortase C-terminal domain/associated protein EpsI [bacterium]
MASKTCIFLILLLTAALALRVAILQRSVLLLPGYTAGAIPAQLAAQPGVNLPLTRFEVELLAPDGGQIIQRRYGQGRTTIWLAAVQSRNDWRVQHPPQICYTAQGWLIEAQTTHTLRDRHNRARNVQRMLVSKDGERRVVYYIYTDGRHWTASYLSRVLHAFWDRAIRAQISTWALIQLSTPLASADAETRLSAACMELVDRAP